MSNTVFDHQILHLTSAFFEDYPPDIYREILEKRDRPYNCLLIQTHYDYFICVPYRSEITHNYAYKFKNSNRSSHHHSGLDYTKSVIISDNKYIDTAQALVDNDEYIETLQNLPRIVREAQTFVEDYAAHCKGVSVLHPSEFRRRYGFSSLKYFHKELHI